MDEEDGLLLSASHRKCILLSGTECHIINYVLTELARLVRGYYNFLTNMIRPGTEEFFTRLTKQFKG